MGMKENLFWEKVNKNTSTGCWEWTASRRNKNGYGQFMIDRKPYSAHRVSWEIHYGDIPEDDSYWKTMHVLHHCDNKICVNPDHLFIGNNKMNVIDCCSKGRNADLSGMKNPMCVFTDNLISEVRSKYAFGKETQQQVGDIYGISRSHVGNLIRHQRRN